MYASAHGIKSCLPLAFVVVMPLIPLIPLSPLLLALVEPLLVAEALDNDDVLELPEIEEIEDNEDAEVLVEAEPGVMEFSNGILGNEAENDGRLFNCGTDGCD